MQVKLSANCGSNQGPNSGGTNLVVVNSGNNGQSVAAIDSTMVAMEERTQSLRTAAATHGLINGGNGGGNGGAKLVGAIIQSKLLPISGGN